MVKKVVISLMLVFFLFPISSFALGESAKSVILMDMDSGRILYQKNKDEPRLIASITKIMTAVLAIESGRLEETVTVGEEVLKMYGSNIYVELNEKMSLRNLVYGLLLRSGNDAAVVIANFICDNEEEFVKLMNEKAKEIGMKNTIFNNAHGLDEETQNYSTAYDMGVLSSYANTLEEYRKISGTKKHIVKGENKTYLWYNRNKLLNSYEYATGGKTGYTPNAGRTLVTTASKDNLNLTAVTLHDPDEYNTHTSLYEYAFANYKKYDIVDPLTFTIDNAYYPDQVYIKESFSYPLMESETTKVKTLAKLTKTEGYKNNEQVGSIVIYLKDEVIKEIPIYVRVKEVKKSWWQKFLSWLHFSVAIV